jgi:hypothetical protein
MCSGGRFIASFTAGTADRPEVPDPVAGCLTPTADGQWVVWAHKMARPEGDGFVPLTGGEPYPADAVAECRRGGRHSAPDAGCSCGFHALSTPMFGFAVLGTGHLEVALSGRILVFEWEGGGVLFRAERQMVIRVEQPEPVWPPADPSGCLAYLPATCPHGAGPVRLRLPGDVPPRVAVDDDAGYCGLGVRQEQAPLLVSC